VENWSRRRTMRSISSRTTSVPRTIMCLLPRSLFSSYWVNTAVRVRMPFVSCATTECPSRASEDTNAKKFAAIWDADASLHLRAALTHLVPGRSDDEVDEALPYLIDLVEGRKHPSTPLLTDNPWKLLSNTWALWHTCSPPLTIFAL
jgi:hypothetical protein